MKRLTHKGSLLTATVLLAATLVLAPLQPARSQTMADSTGLFNAVSVLLRNLEFSVVFSTDDTGAFALESTAAGQKLNVYNSSGTFVGTLTDTGNGVVFSGCSSGNPI